MSMFLHRVTVDKAPVTSRHISWWRLINTDLFIAAEEKPKTDEARHVAS